MNIVNINEYNYSWSQPGGWELYNVILTVTEGI